MERIRNMAKAVNNTEKDKEVEEVRAEGKKEKGK